MDDRFVLRLLQKANKLGAKGIRVIAYIPSQSAGDNSEGIFITDIPIPQGASVRNWYDE